MIIWHGSSVPESAVYVDNGGNAAMYRDWFDHYMERGEDFQIIGLSYYPFWHGTLEDLQNNMNDLAVRYGKELVIAEVSMGFTMEDYKEYEQLREIMHIRLQIRQLPMPERIIR